MKTSQEFIGSKFDEILGAIDGLRGEYILLRDENALLEQRVNDLENKIASIGNDREGLKQYPISKKRFT